MGRSSMVIVQPDASRATVTDRVLPSTVLLLDEDEVPLPDEEAETELLAPFAPARWDRADAPEPSSSIIETVLRPSAA